MGPDRRQSLRTLLCLANPAHRRAAGWSASALRGGFILLLALWAVAGRAACLGDAEVGALVEQFLDKQPVPNPHGLSPADGECSRAKVMRLLEQTLGRPVGYKTALTNVAEQKRFNAQAPVWGALYLPMLLPSDAIIDAAFGARPRFQASLLVRVSDARINTARTPQEVLMTIDQVIPFIELPDLAVQVPQDLDAPALAAINAGARLGVLGRPVVVQRSPQFAGLLRHMQVVVLGDGAELDRGRGADVLDHPLGAVVWLVRELAREGRALKRGDLVSLGALSRLLPPKPGLAVAVRYEGLPGAPDVRINFK
jgi:2-keto-4-pentenoate hydratase